ncbi:MBL fold metallo-hydrolase [Pseudarthrobacter sp. YS3]|uniref:MBL fold metallo-hydrolase n=1 Tax=Pseudarthrobacter sp. YS3 TaxID=3453718 RepID=UPI003EE8BE0B
MIHAGVSATQITRICLTHVHGDHCYGLPGVLSRMALDGVARPVHLHYPASGKEMVRALVAIATPGVDLRLHPHGGAGTVAPGLEVRALNHRIETYGYRLTEPDGRSLVPERLAAAGISGPDVGRLQRDGSLAGVRLNWPTASTSWLPSPPSAMTTPVSRPGTGTSPPGMRGSWRPAPPSACLFSPTSPHAMAMMSQRSPTRPVPGPA